jgi:hypothetical protein
MRRRGGGADRTESLQPRKLSSLGHASTPRVCASQRTARVHRWPGCAERVAPCRSMVPQGARIGRAFTTTETAGALTGALRVAASFAASACHGTSGLAAPGAHARRLAPSAWAGKQDRAAAAAGRRGGGRVQQECAVARSPCPRRFWHAATRRAARTCLAQRQARPMRPTTAGRCIRHTRPGGRATRVHSSFKQGPSECTRTRA